jgi:hypothetical protein
MVEQVPAMIIYLSNVRVDLHLLLVALVLYQRSFNSLMDRDDQFFSKRGGVAAWVHRLSRCLQGWAAMAAGLVE